MKVSRTVWSGGKGSDNLKALPITISRAIMEYYYNKQIMLEVEANYENCDEEVIREIKPYDVANVNKELIEIYKSLN